MAGLIYDPLAKLEIKEAAAYYESCREGLGKAFLETIEKDIQKLAANPLHYRKIRGGFRRCLMDRFPYGIIYSVEENYIFVAAVMQLSRRPDYWRQRFEK